MKTYELIFRYPGLELTDELADRVLEATDSDATLSRINGKLRLSLTVEGVIAPGRHRLDGRDET